MAVSENPRVSKFSLEAKTIPIWITKTQSVESQKVILVYLPTYKTWVSVVVGRYIIFCVGQTPRFFQQYFLQQ